MRIIPIAVLPGYGGRSTPPPAAAAPYTARAWVTGQPSDVRASQMRPSGYVTHLGAHIQAPDRTRAAHPVLQASAPTQSKQSGWQIALPRSKSVVTYVSPGYYMSLVAPSYDDVRRFMDARSVGTGTGRGR
ncbi:MAG: hypothetical protein IVW55_12190 [Chloroflexi bacterium]|nr:hypothetical protein [Chloroflexota bacterium]